MQVPASATLSALDEVDGMAAELASVVSVLDAESAMEAAATAVRTRTGMDVGFVGTTVEDRRALLVRRIAGARAETLPGLRVPTGTGLGGRVLAEGRLRAVEDYPTDQTITHEHDVPISAEGLRSVVAVPIVRAGQVLGVLYGSNRVPGPVGDRVCSALEEIASQTGLLLDAADRVRAIADQAVAQERQRLAGALHDSLGAMLFAIGAGASDLAAQVSGMPEIASRAQALVDRAQAASTALRRSLVGLQEQPAPVALAAELAAQAEAFGARTGILARSVVLTQLPELPDAAVQALVEAVREALHNVEKHADASSVVLTAAASRGGVAVVVADDGRGLGRHLGRGPGPDPTGLGIHQHAIKLARLGGELTLLDDEDGGATVRAWVPA